MKLRRTTLHFHEPALCTNCWVSSGLVLAEMRYVGRGGNRARF